MSATRSATSVDVADRAGVSRATVSYILNNQGERFSTLTVDRVRAAAAELGYVPSAAARSLVRGRSDYVVVLIPHTTFGHNLQEIIELISDYTRTLGLNVVAHFQGRDGTATESLMRTLKPTAVIAMTPLEPEARAAYERRGSLVVELTTSGGLALNEQIGAAQADYLHARGHRGLVYAHLADRGGNVFGLERARGLVQRAVELGLPEPVALHVALNTRAAAAVLKTLEPNVTAVVCYNDEVAIAVIAGARDLGISVPKELAVLGVDGIEAGQLVSPRLSTVRIHPAPFAEFVRSAFRAAGMDPSMPPTGRIPSPADLFEILAGDTA